MLIIAKSDIWYEKKIGYVRNPIYAMRMGRNLTLKINLRIQFSMIFQEFLNLLNFLLWKNENWQKKDSIYQNYFKVDVFNFELKSCFSFLFIAWRGSSS